MADTKVSSMTANSGVVAADLFYADDGTNDTKVTGTQLLTYTNTGTRTVANGGTGATTLTSHGVLHGNGTGAIQATAEMSNGQVLVGATGGVPVPRTLTGPVGLTTAGVTSITDTIQFVIEGSGSAITTGIKGDITVGFPCTITACTMLADQSGSIVVDIWKDTYANYPPTNADSITDAGTSPTITTATKSQPAITSWTSTIAAGDTLRFNVDSATTITRCTIALTVTRT